VLVEAQCARLVAAGFEKLPERLNEGIAHLRESAAVSSNRPQAEFRDGRNGRF